MSFKPLAFNKKYMSFNTKNAYNQLGQFEKQAILVMFVKLPTLFSIMEILPLIEPIPTCHPIPQPPPTTLSLMTIPYKKK